MDSGAIFVLVVILLFWYMSGSSDSKKVVKGTPIAGEVLLPKPVVAGKPNSSVSLEEEEKKLYPLGPPIYEDDYDLFAPVIPSNEPVPGLEPIHCRV